MAVSRVTLILLVATVAVSLTAAKSIENESMDYAHKLFMDMTSGGDEPQAVGPASTSFGRALFGEEDDDDEHDRAAGIELFRNDQIFETVIKSKGAGRLNVAQQDENLFGQEIGEDSHYFDAIMLEKGSEDLEFE